MNIFITGSSGFVGKNLIQKLLSEKKYFIYALEKKKKSNDKNICYLDGRLKDNWNKYLKKTEIFIHLAASGLKKKDSIEKIFKTNVVDSYSLVEKAINLGCKKFILISSSSEYMQNYKTEMDLITKRYPNEYYGLSKCIFSDLILELSKRNKDCKFKIMRLFPIFGKFENFNRLYPSLKRAAKRGVDFELKNPNELRDFTDVEYVVDLISKHLIFKKKNKNFDIFNVSSNNKMTNKKFALSVWDKYNAKGKLIIANNSKK